MSNLRTIFKKKLLFNYLTKNYTKLKVLLILTIIVVPYTSYSMLR